MSSTLNFPQNLQLNDLHVGFILINPEQKVESFSNAIKNWFGAYVKQDIVIPHEFNMPQILSIFSRDNIEYICARFSLSSEGKIYILLLVFKYKFIKENIPQQLLYSLFHHEIKSILDCITDGVYITDRDGLTLMLNKAAEKAWSLPVEELLGQNLRDLYKKIYGDMEAEEIEQNSVCLRVIKDEKEISMIQSGKNDKFKILVTGTPYFENGRLAKVISTERNLTELIELRKQLEQKIEINSKYEAELEYYRSQYHKESDIIIKDEKMSSLLQLAYKVAKQDTTVLLQGESGVGKEVIAKYIHANSPRSDKPFIDINCAAIPENLLESELFGYEKGAFTGASPTGKTGLFELGNLGTLFLDEIGELPFHLQSKILRAVQERKILRIGGNTTIPIDVRIISATNSDLKEAVEQKTFREDLFYRLNVVKILIPPLRERRDDIQALINHFLEIYNNKHGTAIKISSNALNLLYTYSWPGNIRELSNVIEASIATCDSEKITSSQLIEIFPEMKLAENLPLNREDIGLRAEVSRFEKQLLLTQLPLYDSTQNMSKALKIDKSTLIRKMNRYGIKNPFSN